MARNFNGSTAFISGSVGDAAATTVISIVALVRRNVNAVSHCVWNANTALNTPKLALYLNDTNHIVFETNQTSPSASAMTILTAEGWCLVAGTKAAGTVAPRLHKYVYGTDAWTHQAGGATCPDVTFTNTGWQIGKYSTVSWFNGDIELVGVWKRELSDAEIETLPYLLMNWYAAAPNGLWHLDQSLTTQNVVDATGGGASQTGITGTTIATSQLPVFNRGGDLLTLLSRTAAAAGIVSRRTLDPRAGARGVPWI